MTTRDYISDIYAATTQTISRPMEVLSRISVLANMAWQASTPDQALRRLIDIEFMVLDAENGRVRPYTALSLVQRAALSALVAIDAVPE